MRQEVYTKFAEALQQRQLQKKAEDRAAYVHTKFAEALQQRQLQKEAAGGRALVQLARALKRLHVKATPRIDVSGWAKYDPRRLFISKRPVTFTATNYRPGAAEALSGASRAGAYEAQADDAIRAFGDLAQRSGVGETTRLSPGKILAALGLAGGATAAASSVGSGGGGKGRLPLAAIAGLSGLGLAAGGLGAYSAYSASKRKNGKGDKKSKSSNKDSGVAGA